MTPAHLQQWIQHPELLNRETLYELRTWVARYPYFQTARLLYLKNLFLLHDITFGAELRKATLYVTDRRALFYLVEGGRYTLKASPADKRRSLVGEEERADPDRTGSLIDAFLSTVPDELPQQVNLDYATDYLRYLLQEEEVSEQGEALVLPKLRGQELIDGFIEKREPEFGVLRKQAEEADDALADDETADNESVQASELADVEEDEEDSSFTETLAKIYIKQQRYSKALEIIKKINLKNPKKNSYFADQIRFLEKLIINAKSK